MKPVWKMPKTRCSQARDHRKLVDLYEKDGQFNEAIRFQDGLTVMLFVGVNGVGKQPLSGS